MDSVEQKIKHLEFIQSAISRMAQNSFLLKGWSVTLIGAVFALTFKEMSNLYLFISVAALIFFWLLDSYFLSQERLFIKLYNKVRTNPDTDFSMDTTPFRSEVIWWRCALSRTMNLFYGGLFLSHILIMVFL